jgi:hypothetical protein
MDEPRSILERATERLSPSETPREGAPPRRARTNRNRRITAGVVGLTIGLVAILMANANTRSSPQVPTRHNPTRLSGNGPITRSNPQVPTRHNPTRLSGNGPITLVGSGGLRSLSLGAGLDGSPVRCQAACAFVTSAAWSPDGTRIAISGVGCCGRVEDHGISVVEPGTGEVRFLMGPDLSTGSVDWSPDGSRISYVADGRLYTMDADFSNQTQVPGTSDQVVTASWSPDGTRLAYTSGWAVSVIGVDGSDWTLVADSTRPDMLSPVWSRDGEEIAYRRGCAVWVATPDGEHQTRLAELRSFVPGARCGSAPGPPSRGRSLAWSPDGLQIAVLLEDSQHIVLMQADGSNVRVISIKQRRFESSGIAWQPVASGT